MNKMEESIEKALNELESKSLDQIQYETAINWCGRACAAVVLGKFTDAREYAHEAIEHAALSKTTGLLQSVYNILSAYGVEY